MIHPWICKARLSLAPAVNPIFPSQGYNSFKRFTPSKLLCLLKLNAQTIISYETSCTENIDQNSRCSSSRSWGSHFQLDVDNDRQKPNKLSEELIKSLIGIFLELNQATFEMKGSAIVPKCSLSSMKPRGLMSKTSFSCTASPFSWDSDKSNLDPYRMLQDLDGAMRDIGPYKEFVQITRNSIDKNHLSECHPAMRKLR